MRSNAPKSAAQPSPFPTLTLPMLVVVWSVSATVGGVLAGLIEWRYEPERVPPFQPLATYVLWRSLSAALAAVVCGLVIHQFSRGRDDSTWLLMPGALLAIPISRNHSVPEVLLFAALMGLALAGMMRISSRYADRRDPAKEADGV